MKVNIRRNVFETNSSSTHSIVIRGNDSYCNDLCCDEFLNVCLKEFDGGPDVLFSFYDKLCYVLVSIQYFESWCNSLDDLEGTAEFTWLHDLFMEKRGVDLKIEENSRGISGLGYIDHESCYLLKDLWSDNEEVFKTNMEEFIFNDKYVIVIDNDNSCYFKRWNRDGNGYLDMDKVNKFIES